MSDDFGHPRDELQLLLDERLPAGRDADVRAHLAGCAPCRGEMEALQRLRSGLRKDLPRHEVPLQVSDRIRAALAVEAASPRGVGHAAPTAAPLAPEETVSALPRRAFVIGGAALAAAAVVALLFARRRGDGPVAQAADDFERFAADRLEMELRTPDPAELERFFAARALDFPTRVFDFAMMGFKLVGGSVGRLGDGPSALFAYRGAEGGRVVCQMYRGVMEDLPAAQEERVANQIRFLIYRRPSHTLVFWEEGPVVCVLAHDGEPGAALDLAVAKAGMG